VSGRGRFVFGVLAGALADRFMFTSTVSISTENIGRNDLFVELSISNELFLFLSEVSMTSI
jgi:hypothetical protein